MLVLSRMVGEKIFVGDDITITICSIRSGGVIRVGVEAPQDVLILREEIAGRAEHWGRRDNDDGPIHPEAVG